MSLPFKKIMNKIKILDAKIKTQDFDGNLNDLKTTGFYYADGNVESSPLKGYSYYITVLAYNDNYVLQQASRVTNALENMSIQQRQYFNGKWTAWQEV